MKRTIVFLIILFVASGIVKSQNSIETGQFPGENEVKVSGEMTIDERFLLRDSKD